MELSICPVFGNHCSIPKNFVATFIINGETVTSECCQKCATILTQHKASVQDNLKCAGCEHTLEDFSRTGRLGCPLCYVWFKPYVEKVLEQLHPSLENLGKRPNRDAAPVVDFIVQQLKNRQNECPEDSSEFENINSILSSLKNYAPPIP
jgi:protein-arginine kinase activator protein McsA